MSSPIIISTHPSSSSSYSTVREEREVRDYHATKHTSTSTRIGSVVIHNHNQGIEDPDAPTPSSYSQTHISSSSSRSKRRS